jgi:diacylglycerol kinase (ATP)
VTGAIHLLVNPAAGGGRARRQLDRACAALRALGPLEVVASERPRDEARLAVLASRADARALVVLGGDGAVSHAARGLIAERSETPLAVFAAGTGNDFVKSLGTPSHDYEAMAALIGAGHTRALDAGLVDDVPFVNAAGFGFDVDVLQRMRETAERAWLRGTARYVMTALRRLFTYGGFDATLASGAATTTATTGAKARWMMLVFANGAWFGGAFHIAPEADVANGTIECIGIRDVAPLARARLFARAMQGRHVAHPAVHAARGGAFTLRFDTAPHFEADGELHLASSPLVTVRCLPHALRAFVAS